MEKIQSAIAKARADRAMAPGAQAASSAAQTMPSQTPPAISAPAIIAVETQWAALEEFQPDADLLRRNRILAHGGGPEAVTFDMMRTRVLQQMRANNWRRLGITSPGMECGKTTTCLNLAFSLARQADQRTVVAEVDLRRPSMSRTLGFQRPHSFASVLEGGAVFQDQALRYGNNLCFATNSTASRNSAELLQNPHVGTALAEIEAQYQPTLMIFDLPPMLVSDDVMAFIGQVDCVLLIAAAEKTTIQEVDICERDLAAHTNVMGVVLNKCRYLDKSYGYYA